MLLETGQSIYFRKEKACTGGLACSGHLFALKSRVPGTGMCWTSGYWEIFYLPQTACPLGFRDNDTNKCSWGWRSPTFLGLLELSWLYRKDQFGSDSKFSIVLRNIVFIFLSLRRGGKAQKQDLSRHTSEPPILARVSQPSP